MIYIRRHINSKHQSRLLLKFPIYSNEEILHIAKLRTNRFLLLNDQNKTDSDSKSKLLHKFNEDGSFSAENGSLLSDETKIAGFINALKECLPQFRMNTNHPVDIFNSAYLVWKLRQDSNGNCNQIEPNRQSAASNVLESTIASTAQAVARLPFLCFIPESANDLHEKINIMNTEGLLNNASCNIYH